MKLLILKPLIGLLIPMLTGFLVPPLWGAIKQSQKRLAGLPPAVQRGVVIVLSGGISALALLLGIDVPTDLSVWTEGTVNTILGAALAMAIHSGDKTRQLQKTLSSLRLEAFVEPDPIPDDSPFKIPGGR